MKKPPEPDVIRGAVAIAKAIGRGESTFRRWMSMVGHPLRRVVQMDSTGTYVLLREDLERYLGSLPTVAARKDRKR